jgi:hypothetical protein
MAKLITEMSMDFELFEDKKANEMYAVGIFSSAELVNNNKRIYKKEILEREITKVQDKASKKSLWGELGHPPNPEVNPDKIAILTTQLEWRGNDVYGKAKILDTPMGNIAKTLIKEGRMGISSRGLGTVGDKGYVNEDFNLITWDLVTDPSNSPSWVNGIFEGQEFQIIPVKKNEISEADIKKAQRYYSDYLKNFLDSMLKEAEEGVIHKVTPATIKELAFIFKKYKVMSSKQDQISFKEDILKWVVQIYPKMNVNNFKQIARMGDFSDTFLEGDEETTYQKGKMFGKPINPKDTEDMQYKTMLKIRGRTR